MSLPAPRNTAPAPPKHKPILSRLSVVEIRAAEVLRHLHGVRIDRSETTRSEAMHGALHARRALPDPFPFDEIMHEGKVLRRPTKSSLMLIAEAIRLLVACGLVERPGTGLVRITALGRAEAEAWFPELRTS